MKISLSWIKEYVPVKARLDDIVERLTLSGTEVEHVEKAGQDTVLEMEVTPNRADCLSHWGLARELAAIYDCRRKPVKRYSSKIRQVKNLVSINSFDDCAHYSGTIIDGVSVTPANKTIQAYLKAIGIRPISNMVDITNYCLMELGQPMHVFDYDKLEGGQIFVRRAKKGESIVTLDGEHRELDPSILVIADAKRPVAIAGIMGGKDTEVTSKTKKVLLECAHFNQVLIRRAGRKIGLSSDSSYRFERGIDRAATNDAKKRALFLLLSEAGGKVIQEQVVRVAKKSKGKKLSVSIDSVNERLGANLTKSRCATILKNLDFSVSSTGKSLSVTVPSFRPDVDSFEDIVEEIARIIGYDNVPQALPLINASNIDENPLRKIRQVIEKQCVAQGFAETITYSMINLDALKKSNVSAENVTAIKNPLTQDQTHMRPSLLPGALDVLKTNINRGQKDLKLFELGKVFDAKQERWALSLLITGQGVTDWRQLNKSILDFFDLKGMLEILFCYLRIDKTEFGPVRRAHFEEGQSAAVVRAGKTLAEIGKVSQGVLSQWGIKAKDVYYAELDVDQVCQKANIEKVYVPVSEFPSIVQDISLAVEPEVSYDQIRKIVWENGGQWLKSMDFKELYLGEKLPDGHRGIVFSLTFQSSSETLRESDVLNVVEHISKALSEDLGAIKR